MNTLEFLQRVLPDKGFYFAFVVSRGSPQQASYATLEELAANCLKSDGYKNNTFFACSAFQTRANRKQVNVRASKVLFLDVDCAEDKPFKTQSEGLTALLKFIQAVGLPNPLIVSSGRGLHVYWVMDEPIPPAEWQPMADALKQLCVVHQFPVDPVVTGDSSRVLRPVGTHNPKNGAEVRILLDATPVHKDVLKSVLDTSRSKSQTTPVPTPLPATIRDPNKSGLLASMSVDQDFPPASPIDVMKKCGQIKWGVTHQKDVAEPMWYSMLGVAAYCIEAEETAKAWSLNHPAYSEAATLRKLKHWKDNTTGPATCAKFKEERPKGCDKCPFAGKITSPAAIGIQRPSVGVSASAPDLELAREIAMPKGYDRRSTKDSRTYIVQILDGTDIPLAPFDLYPVSYGKDESLGYEVVRFKWERRHHGWTDLVFRQALLNFGNAEFPTKLADQGIVLSGKKQTDGFQNMLRSYMDELRAQKSMTNIYGSMGWKEEFTEFVIGDKVYRKTSSGAVVAENIPLTSTSNRLGHTLYSQKGTVEAWRNGTRLLHTHKLPWHAFALCQAFSAPLWAFTGLHGMTVSLFGRSGGGKSLAQLWQQSVWGDPSKLSISAKSTQNALFNRLGMYCNLPMTIDECTEIDPKTAGSFVYWVTEGTDKSRLTRGADERESKTWDTTVTISTNASWVDKLQSLGMDNDAQMIRLLEIGIPQHPMFAKGTAAGRSIHKHILANYGVVGDLMAREYMRLGADNLRNLIGEATETITSRYNFEFAGAERFWEQNIILTDVGSKIAEDIGVLGFDYRDGIEWVLRQVPSMRASVQETRSNAFDLIDDYVNEIAAEVLVVMHTEGHPSVMDETRVPRASVKARFDKYRKMPVDKFDRGTLMLAAKAFKPWLASKGYDYKVFKKEINAESIDATPKSGRIWMGRNTSLSIGQQHVVGVNLVHPKLAGYLEDIP